MRLRHFALHASLVATMMIPATTTAAAQNLNSLSCNQLWYARNSIYARNGYCFESRRGIDAFGRGCFPPYGRVAGADAREVARIQAAERRRGC